jgi:hypothetical protein
LRSRLAFTVLGAWLFVASPSAWSILIETGPKQRVGGYLLSEDAKQLKVRIKTPDGKDKVELFERAKIKIIHKVDLERLEKLSKDQPKAYRKYADELAEQEADPEAKELALRLFLIAAYFDSPNLGRPCLLSMSTLAANPADARKYRAMAFLLGSKADPTLLKTEAIKAGPSTSPKSKAQENAFKSFQLALRKYRAGQVKNAKDLANEDGVAYFFGIAPGMMDQKSFILACNDVTCTKCKAGSVVCTACNGQGKIVDGFGAQLCATCNGKGKQKCSSCDGSGLNPFPEDRLKAVLRAEIWALDQVLVNEATKKSAAAGGWSNALNSQQAPLPTLTLETIAQHDPRQCVFRKGEWVVP